MKALFIPLSLALASCGVSSLPAPNTVADRTTLDERAAIAVEMAYQAAAQLALSTGAAKRENVKAADRRAYAAVKAARDAYSAGNASSYAAAAAGAHTAVASFLTALRG